MRPTLSGLPAAMLLCLPALCLAQQSDVRVYGILDVFAGNSNNSGGVATRAINNGGMTTSYYGIGGHEELGGGLKAVFALEGVVRLDTGESGRFPNDPMFSRAAYVGLSGSGGTFKLGRVPNPLFQASAAVNPYAFSTRFSPLMTQLWSAPYGSAVTGDTGWSNALHYTSPTLGGVTIVGQYAPGENPATPSHNAAAVLRYEAGPLLLVAGGQRVEAGLGITAAAPRQDTWLTGVAYDLHAVKLYGSYDRNRTDGTGRRTRTAQLGLQIPSGAGRYLLSWARSHEETLAKPQFRRDTATAGYDYSLSVRTDVYAVFVYDKLSTASDGNTTALGIRHKF
ncbi:MAG: porin [Pseudomonadota bacterium]